MERPLRQESKFASGVLPRSISHAPSMLGDKLHLPPENDGGDHSYTSDIVPPLPAPDYSRSPFLHLKRHLPRSHDVLLSQDSNESTQISSKSADFSRLSDGDNESWRNVGVRRPKPMLHHQNILRSGSNDSAGNSSPTRYAMMDNDSHRPNYEPDSTDYSPGYMV
ncbi:hypothetical protein BX600DRAFT_502989 [Xylariales sp. PMI_506]|nr:hypothetical protein BX600DRAFT_502989 [Xylariales sp. PMI_506]